jgi:hypothetical protein
MAQQDYRGAHQVWRSFFARGADQRQNLIFDPDFRGLEGSGPFNWSFTSNEFIQAASAPARSNFADKAAQIDYFGSGAATALVQSLVLSPGDYQLQAAVKGPETVAAGAAAPFRWTVRCRAPEGAVAELPIRLTPRWARHTWTFSVPANCQMQDLRLDAINSDGAGEVQSISVTAVSLTPRS